MPARARSDREAPQHSSESPRSGGVGGVGRLDSQVAEERGVKPGVLIHATRVAVTGQAVSPGLFEVLEVIGRDRVLARLGEVIAE